LGRYRALEIHYFAAIPIQNDEPGTISMVDQGRSELAEVTGELRRKDSGKRFDSENAS
jgi:hypothetical protein